MRDKINWAHAQKKGYISQIAQMVSEHDAATATQQAHLRVGFAVFIQAKYLHLETPPCTFCGENIVYMNEARTKLAEIAAQTAVQEQPPTIVEETRKKAKSKGETKQIEGTDKID